MKRRLSLLLILCMILTCVDGMPTKATTGTRVSGQLNLIQEGAIVGTEWRQGQSAQRLWTTRTTKTAKETIYQGITSMQESIDLTEYKITFEELMTTVTELINEAPELFYIGTKVSAYEDDDKYITKYLPDYKYTADEVETMQGELDAAVKLLMSGIDESWSDVEKALYVHDYLVSQFTYDTTFTKYDMYSLLVEGTAVCQGYTLTYIYVMNQLGIPCIAVPSDTMGHIWNQVQINGNWYHVDMTYDDPIPDIAGSVRHDNFLVSDTMIATRANNEHSDWVSDYTCTDTTYDNYFWVNSHAPFVYDGNSWYYVNTVVGENAGIYKWEPAAGTTTCVVDLSNEKWTTDSGAYYTKLYAGLVYCDGNIYYNTQKNVYYFSVDEPEKIQKADIPTVAASDSIWGIQCKDYELMYSVGSAYNSNSNTSTGITFEKPEVTVAPTATPTAEPSATPAATATTEPSTTEAPNTTADPSTTPAVTATAEPSTTEAPNTTAEPSATPAVTATAEPNVTEAPTSTAEPSTSEAPSTTLQPSTTEQPSTTAEPSTTPAVTATAEPSVTEAPNATTEPNATEAPTPTADPSTSEAPSTIEAPSTTGEFDTTLQPNLPKASIRITAKKGKRKITVRVPKKVKTVIKCNKKIIRKKKKKSKKYKVLAKNNKSGKITLRLSKKLRKGMKIRVTIYTKQGKISVTKKIK